MDKLIENLNQKYEKLTPVERLRELYNDFDAEKVLITSSFGTSSVYLLNLLSQANKKQKVYFIDTKYLFSETIEYKNQICVYL